MTDDATVAELIEGINGGPPRVRAKCALVLGGRRMADEEAREALTALRAAVKDESVEVRMNVVWALGEIGPTAVLVLIEALKDELWLVRSDSAYALGQIGPQAGAAIPALIEASKDTDYWVRAASAGALDRIDPAAKGARGR